MRTHAPRTRIKICGVTTPREAMVAIDAGADAVGMIFANSPRAVSIECARTIARVVPAFVSLVAVFVDPLQNQVDEAVQIGCIPQFSGRELPENCSALTQGPYIKAFHVSRDGRETTGTIASAIEEFAAAYPQATLLFDSAVPDGRRGGTGVSFDWESVRAIAATRPSIVSGGLNPGNVGECVRQVRPYAVDVRSGVEIQGRQDSVLIEAFVAAVREADAQA